MPQIHRLIVEQNRDLAQQPEPYCHHCPIRMRPFCLPGLTSGRKVRRRFAHDSTGSIDPMADGRSSLGLAIPDSASSWSGVTRSSRRSSLPESQDCRPVRCPCAPGGSPHDTSRVGPAVWGAAGPAHPRARLDRVRSGLRRGVETP